MLPQILWTHYFLEAQGYDIKENIVHQDNKSAILLEINGKGSSSKQTKHIKIRYFFVKDKIDAGEILIKHCPTKSMWADALTKPKQGRAFREMRKIIMNIDDENSKITKKISKSVSRKEPKLHTVNYDQSKNKKQPILNHQSEAKGLQECVGGQRSRRTCERKMRQQENKAKPQASVRYRRPMPIPVSK